MDDVDDRPEEFRAKLAAEADRLEEDCLYSAKGHFESAKTWSRWNLWLGIPAVLLAAGAGAAKDTPELASGLAFAAAAVTAVLTFLKPSDRASSHQRAGALYNSLKNRARFFRTIELTRQPFPSTLEKRLRLLCEERNQLGEASPEIPPAAFARARRGIEEGEAEYRADRPALPAEGRRA